MSPAAFPVNHRRHSCVVVEHVAAPLRRPLRTQNRGHAIYEKRLLNSKHTTDQNVQMMRFHIFHMCKPNIRTLFDRVSRIEVVAAQSQYFAHFPNRTERGTHQYRCPTVDVDKKDAAPLHVPIVGPSEALSLPASSGVCTVV